MFYLRASVWRCTVRVKLAARPTPIACPLCHSATKWKAGATHSFPKSREKERKANTVPATKREETRDVRIFFFLFQLFRVSTVSTALRQTQTFALPVALEDYKSRRALRKPAIYAHILRGNPYEDERGVYHKGCMFTPRFSLSPTDTGAWK